MEQQAPTEAIIAFRLSEAMVPAHRMLYHLFDGDLTLMLVLGELAQYSAKSPLNPKRPNTGSTYRPCNAHSIALASGIPRETVRRKLEKLIKRGWVIQMPNGDLSLNREIDPPLHIHFREYNKQLLDNMRAAIRDLDGIEFSEEPPVSTQPQEFSV